jgi:hypothetical protein
MFEIILKIRTVFLCIHSEGAQFHSAYLAKGAKCNCAYAQQNPSEDLSYSRCFQKLADSFHMSFKGPPLHSTYMENANRFILCIGKRRPSNCSKLNYFLQQLLKGHFFEIWSSGIGPKTNPEPTLKRKNPFLVL